MRDNLEAHKCVITPNPNAYSVENKPWAIEVPLPKGTPIMESFHYDADGKRVVDFTLIAGVGIVDGELPKK